MEGGAMLYPDHETRRLLVGEHQAELRRLAQQPQRQTEQERLLTTVMLSRSASRRAARSWLRWRRRQAHGRTAPAA
jgi:hypothetical protein